MHYLIEFIILSHSSRSFIFIPNQAGRLNASFKSLMVTLTIVLHQGISITSVLLFWFGEGKIKLCGFPLSLFYHNRSCSEGQETNVKILPVSEYISFNCTLKNWENNHRKGLGFHWTYCKVDSGYNSFDHLTSLWAHSNQWTTVTFWVSINHSQRSAISED